MFYKGIFCKKKMGEDEYGEFEEINDEGSIVVPQEGEAPARVKLPRDGEVIGMILQRFGGNRMEVIGTDGKTRNARVPGRFKRKMWLRPKI